MKEGDKIICIYPRHYIDGDGKYIPIGTDLNVCGIYTIDYFLSRDVNYVVLMGHSRVSYDIKRFRTLGEYRKMKLKNIVNKIYERRY